MKVGDRVCHKTQGVGYIETVDNDSSLPSVDIRWLTPDNVPSVLSSCVFDIENVIVVPDTVLPQPRSKQWKRESDEFYRLVLHALDQAEINGGEE